MKWVYFRVGYKVGRARVRMGWLDRNTTGLHIKLVDWKNACARRSILPCYQRHNYAISISPISQSSNLWTPKSLATHFFPNDGSTLDHYLAWRCGLRWNTSAYKQPWALKIPRLYSSENTDSDKEFHRTCNFSNVSGVWLFIPEKMVF